MGMGPLFPVEPVSLSVDDLHRLAVGAFSEDWARENIWLGFTTLLVELQAIGVRWDIYVDGSFVTDKVGPGDIDLLLVALCPTDGYGPEQQDRLLTLAANRDRLKREQRCDVQLLVQPSSHTDMAEQVDQVLNMFVINEFGPPKRAIRLATPVPE